MSSQIGFRSFKKIVLLCFLSLGHLFFTAVSSYNQDLPHMCIRIICVYGNFFMQSWLIHDQDVSLQFSVTTSRISKKGDSCTLNFPSLYFKLIL